MNYLLILWKLAIAMKILFSWRLNREGVRGIYQPHITHMLLVESLSVRRQSHLLLLLDSAGVKLLLQQPAVIAVIQVSRQTNVPALKPAVWE